MENEKWTYITTARDAYKDVDGNQKFTSEYVTDDTLYLFASKQEAFGAAEKSAMKEVDGLNEDIESSDGKSFGIPEDSDYEQRTEIKVLCYSDDETELVTRRVLKKVNANISVLC